MSTFMQPQRITIQTRAPRVNYPGAVEIGYWFAEDGKVYLCDSDGVETGVSKALTPGEDAREAAVRLLRGEVRKGSRWNDFNRPLHYPKLCY
jgi:hypothetical protein